MDLMIDSLPRLLKASRLTLELTFLSLFFGIFVMWFLAFYMGFSQPISSKKLEQTFKNYFK